jgi:hypothetical protein
MDQSLFAAPHGLSQRITSFIACACQGIHQLPFSHLIVLIANDHPNPVIHASDTFHKAANDSSDPRKALLSQSFQGQIELQ